MKVWWTILSVVTLIIALGLAQWIGVWGLLVPVALCLVSFIPFRNVRDADAPAFGSKTSVPNVPKHDLRNLH
jgi:hypothetical protein